MAGPDHRVPADVHREAERPQAGVKHRPRAMTRVNGQVARNAQEVPCLQRVPVGRSPPGPVVRGGGRPPVGRGPATAQDGSTPVGDEGEGPTGHLSRVDGWRDEERRLLNAWLSRRAEALERPGAAAEQRAYEAFRAYHDHLVGRPRQTGDDGPP